MEQGTVAAMGIELYFYSQAQVQKLFFSSPIRIKSYAFRRTHAFLEVIVSYFETNGVLCMKG